MLTGLSREVARFQARSAFTGAGFTTSESEMVLNHPVRRRIIMLLMLMGNAGIVTVVATLVITFAQSGDADQWLFRVAVLSVGFIILWFVSWNRVVDRSLSGAIAWGLKTFASVDARDYAHILHLSGDYGVVELAVKPEDWLAEKTLAEMGLRSEGVIVLGVQRPNGQYVGAPHGETRIQAGDTAILYGRNDILADLDNRRRTDSGEIAHEQARQEQERVRREERNRTDGE